MRQRILTLLLACTMLLGLVGCTGSAVSTQQSEVTARIGIAWLEEETPSEDTQAYIDAIILAGGEPVLLPQVENMEQAKEALATVGGVIMTGGEDIDPSYYGHEPYELLEEINEARDVSDFWMITAALEEDVPMLATCRGLQMLNAILGGTLYQDLPTQYQSELVHRDPELIDFTYHEIEVYEGSKLADLMGTGVFEVNSWHHQGIQELGEGLVVTAMSPDGIIEGVEYQDASYVVGVQFHPEWHVVEGEEAFLPFFEQLVTLASK